MSWFKILLCSMLCMVSSAPIPYESCGSGTLIIRDISVEPFPLQKSVDSTLTVHASLNKAISSGQYDINVELGGLQIYSKSGDLCSLDQSICPQKAGEKTIVKNFSIPSLAPSGTYTTKATMNNGDELIACYTLSFSLN
jgi:hypothetical protein